MPSQAGNSTDQKQTGAEGQLVRLFGEKKGGRLWNQVREAGSLFGSDRHPEAEKLLAPIASQAPDVAEVRELYGLVLYRLGHWRKAIRELEAFRGLTGETVEQHPVLCDCYRALGLWAKAEEVWEEFQMASPAPSPDLAAEGRIVYAGALADQGKFAEAVALLESNWLPLGKAAKAAQAAKSTGRAAEKSASGSEGDAQKSKSRQSKTASSQCSPETSLRLVYMLADLHDRTGDTPKAAALFRWITDRDPDFVDAADRLRELGS